MEDSLLPVKSRFLDGSAPREFDEVVAAAASKQLSANSVVMSQGQPANHLFLLAKGRARYFFLTEDGRKLLLHWVLPGEIFGVSTLFAKRASHVLGVEVVEESAVLTWGRTAIRRCVTKYPQLLHNTLPIFADYVSRHVALQEALSQPNGRHRLAQVLVTLARAIGQETQGGSELNVTNAELAAMSNVTVFTTSRLLNEWQRKGVLAKSRRKILLQFPERLLPVEA